MSEKKSTTATKTAATETAAQAADEKKEAVAYIGPTISHVAINGTIYSNGLPESLEAKAKEIPAIKGLLIPVSRLAASGVAVTTEGSALNTLYKKVLAELEKKGE